MFKRFITGRLVFRSIGVVLLIAGLFFAYWWFYKLAPCRRALDPQWIYTHSESEYWQEVQSSIRRGMWFHDYGFIVGFYGDKEWAEWIMARVKPDECMDCFGRFCHSDYSMQLITNQDIGETGGAWLEWWEKNKDKSQEAWIADGFKLRGVDVAASPTPEQTEALLAILGDEEGNQGTTIPHYLKYNAFRWLRDSGFEPIVFALAKISHSAAVERGLKQYGEFQRRWPTALKLGILSVGKTPYDPDDYDLPPAMQPKYQAAAYAVIFVPLIVGIGLILLSLRRAARR